MKKELLLIPAFAAAASFSQAEIVVNDYLSFEGFVDMSYSYYDAENSDDVNESENSFAIDQVEISWLFDFDPVTAQIDLQYEDLPGEDTVVEQAFATYHFGNGMAITAGRYASMLGFEAFEPTGLYQYSFAYDLQALDQGDFDGLLDDLDDNPGDGDEGPTDVTLIPGYAQGVKFTYETDTTFFGISLQDEVFDIDNDRLGGDNESSFGVEVAGSITMENGLTVFLGGAYENAEDIDGDEGGNSWVVNAYATFETGAWIFAAEVNYGESDADAFAIGLADDDEEKEEAFQALLMANFAYSEKASVTARVSYVDHVYEDEPGDFDSEFDFFKLTLAHGYAFTDNLFLVNEISYIDGYAYNGEDGTADSDFDSLIFAAELIFSF